MSKKYLLKLEFDCNDADYVYGCKIISEKDKEIIKANGNKLVSFGSCDFGENEQTADETFSLIEITSEEEKMLKRLGLHNFGEGAYWSASELLEAEESDDESEWRESGKEVDDESSDVINEDDGPQTILIVNNKSFFFLRARENPESTREVIVEVDGVKYEKIFKKDRATYFSFNKAMKVLQSLSANDFAIMTE